MGDVELPNGATPIAGPLRDELLNPLAAAATVAIQEVARTEAVLNATFGTSTPLEFGQRSAAINVNCASGGGCLVLSVSDEAARELASRVLAGQNATIDAALIDDCLGEIANVIAGQGKALLYGTSWHYTFGTPTKASGAGRAELFTPHAEWYILQFASNVGPLYLQVAAIS